MVCLGVPAPHALLPPTPIVTGGDSDWEDIVIERKGKGTPSKRVRRISEGVEGTEKIAAGTDLVPNIATILENPAKSTLGSAFASIAAVSTAKIMGEGKEPDSETSVTEIEATVIPEPLMVEDNEVEIPLESIAASNVLKETEIDSATVPVPEEIIFASGPIEMELEEEKEETGSTSKLLEDIQPVTESTAEEELDLEEQAQIPSRETVSVEEDAIFTPEPLVDTIEEKEPAYTPETLALETEFTTAVAIEEKFKHDISDLAKNLCLLF